MYTTTLCATFLFGLAHATPFTKRGNGNYTLVTADVNTLPTTDVASNPINGLLAGLAASPIIGGTVNALSGTLTAGEAILATTLGIDTTESAGNSCAAMTLIFARGTTEPGNVGLATGPPFIKALQNVMGKSSLDVQGVEYSASIEGFLAGGDAAGSQAMATLITNTMKNCPSTKVVMSGYSQGGQLVHNAAKLLPAATMAKVSSVVIFGDPDFGAAVQGTTAAKTLVVCHPDDNICQHGDLILLAHLTYSVNAPQAASFVAANSGLSLGH